MSTTHNPRILKKALSKANQLLAGFADAPAFEDKFRLVFGVEITASHFEHLLKRQPQIIVATDGELQGAAAAFSAQTGKIYLSASFLQSASLKTITSAILEEIGHYIDSEVKATDTPGDEGAIFAGLVSGNPPTAEQLQILTAENDDGLMTIRGDQVPIEKLSLSTTNLSLTTADALANSLLGAGFTASNVSFSGAPVSAGFFSGGVAAGLGIESGIILSTGNIADAVGPNNLASKGIANNTLGDADLNLIVAPQLTRDASVLTFDFIPTKPVASFSFVFASEEYPEYANSAFNDVFALYVNGQNVAIIPGTTTPVSINNLNNVDNPDFYVSNHGSSPAPYDTQFDAFTTILSAVAENLAPGLPAKVKLAIADTSDSILDSAVFLQADSLGSGTTVTVSTTDTTAAEGVPADSGVVTIRRTGSTTNPLTVRFGLSGSADNSDFKLTPSNLQTAVIPAGQEATSITITPTDDGLAEGGETVILSLIDSSSYDLGESNSAVVVITDNEPQTNAISLSLSPDSATEGSSASLIYTFTRSGSTASPFTVDFVVGGSADLDQKDYTTSGAASFSSTEGKITFAANSATASIAVTPLEDTLIESNETVDLALRPGVGYTIGTPLTVSGTIINNDQSVTLDLNPSSVDEIGSADLVYTFTRTGLTTNPLTVNYVVAGTATFDTDYSQSGAATFNSLAGTVTIPAGAASTKLILSPTVDSDSEADETVVLELASGLGYSIAKAGSVTGVIRNSDNNAAVSLSVLPQSVTEEGNADLTYTFTRTGPTAAPLTINYAVAGTAAFSSDYTQSGADSFSSTAGSVTFAAGSTSATVSLDASADTDLEGDETVSLTLAPGSGYTVSTVAAVTGTILKDINDGPAAFVIAGSPAEGQTLTVNRTNSDPDGDGVPLYRWQSSSDGIQWKDLANNSASYKVNAADLGQSLRVIVTYSDGDGFSESVTTSAVLAVKPSATAPQLLNAEVDGDLLTLSFDSELTNTPPSTTSFTIRADGTLVSIASVSISGGDGVVNLTLQRPIEFGEIVTAQYRDLTPDQTSAVIQGLDGRDVATFNTDVRNNALDLTPPSIVSASVNGQTLEVGFNEAIAYAAPDLRSWTILEEGRSIPISSITPIGESARVMLTLSRPVSPRTAISLRYGDLIGNQRSGVVEDLVGNDLPTQSDINVENQTQGSIDSLKLNSAEVDADQLTLTFDRELDSATPPARAFRVTADGSTQIDVASVETLPDSREVVLELAEKVTATQRVLVSYTDPSGDQRSGVVQDLDGNDLASFTQQLVRNITTETSQLELDSVEIVDADLTLNFTAPIAAGLPSISRFKVLADGKRQRIESLESTPDDGVLRLRLKKPVLPNQDVKLSYTDLDGNQATGVVQDVRGVDLGTLKNVEVTNFSVDETPPSLKDAFLDGRELTLEFDELINPGTLQTSLFRLSVNDKRATISSATVDRDSDIAVLLLDTLPSVKADLAISYRDPLGDQSSGVLQDLAGNDAVKFRDFAVEVI